MEVRTLSGLSVLTRPVPKKMVSPRPQISTKPTVVPAATGQGFWVQAFEDGGRIKEMRVATVVCDQNGEKVLPWGPFLDTPPCGARARFRAEKLILVSVFYDNGAKLLIEELWASPKGNKWDIELFKGSLVVESWVCACGHEVTGPTHDGAHLTGNKESCRGRWSSTFVLPEKVKRFTRAINAARVKAHCIGCTHLHSY